MQSDEVRVLVVDDEPDVRDTLAAQLMLDGYSVATAASVEEAILQCEQEQPHCVLLDFAMPGMDGYDLATALRHRYKDDVVLIAVTGWSEQHGRVADTFSVVDHFLRKPVDPKALRTLLPTLGKSGRQP